MPRKPSKKAIDKRIERLYYASCSGVTIPLFDIPKVFAAGRAAVADGADDRRQRRNRGHRRLRGHDQKELGSKRWRLG